MLLTEIASFLNIATNNQLSPEQIVLIMDSIQKGAFQKNLDAFLVYNQKVEILTQLNFSASTLEDPADIGSILIGQVSGAFGTLVAIYEDYVTLSDVTGTFTAGESADNGTTGVTVANTSDFQTGWRGPYEAPENCRKIWGITHRTPGRFNFFPYCAQFFAISGVWQTTDYNFVWGVQRPFEGGMVNDLDKTFWWAHPPVIDEQKPYYWVYWKNPDSITELDDSSQLKVPEAYHLQFKQCCIVAARADLNDGDFTDATIDKYLGGWIDSMRAPYRNMKGFQNLTQGEQDGGNRCEGSFLI